MIENRKYQAELKVEKIKTLEMNAITRDRFARRHRGVINGSVCNPSFNFFTL